MPDLTKKIKGLVLIFFLLFGTLSLTLLSSCGGGGSGGGALDAISRVSVDTSGTETDNGNYYPSISSDGRYVVFDSAATNLVAGDGNGFSDIFLRDELLGTTIRISEVPGGGDSNSTSDQPVISSDGRYVAFYSAASDLVAGDVNGLDDVFLHDTQTNTTILVSVHTSGAQGNDDSSFRPAISMDGRYVAFVASATNLVDNDTNALNDIFVRDTVNDTTIRVNVDMIGFQATGGHSYDCSISDDGRYVAFQSDATNLVAGDGNGFSDIFVRDTWGLTTRISEALGGGDSDNGSYSPSISSNGMYVAFVSAATDLVAGDANGKIDIFLRDTQTNTTTRMSVHTDGTEGDNNSNSASIGSNGRYVAFASFATTLVAGDANGIRDIFVRNTVDNTTIRVNVDSSGAEGDGDSNVPYISADGRYVAFQSYATNLVAGDGNGSADIFRAPNE